MNALVQHIAAKGAYNASVFATRSAPCCTSTATDRRSQILDYLTGAGLKPQGRGKFVRIPATWRGGDGHSVSVNAETGWAKDFVTGEAFCWDDLAAKIGAGPLADDRLTSEQRQASRVQAKSEESTRIALAKSHYDKARSISMNDAEIDVASLKKELTFIRSDKRKTKAFGEQGEERKKIPLPDEIVEAYQYLDSRNARAFAVAAGARVGKKFDDELKIWAGWQIVWPYRLDTTATFRGVQRETGRGHGGKKMMGPKSGASLYVRPRTDEMPKVFVIGEGAMTVKAVWNHVDCHAWIKFDAGNLASINGGHFEKMVKIDTVYLLCDHDRSKIDENGREVGMAGQKACQAAAEAILMHRQDLCVKIAMPAAEGEDWDDVESRTTPDQFREEFLASLADPLPPSAPSPGGSRATRTAPAYSGRSGADHGAGQGSEPGTTAEIISIGWTRKVEPTLPPMPVGLSIAEAEITSRREIRAAVDALGDAENRKAFLAVMPPGTGKTAETVTALITSTSAGPILIATPRLEDVKKIAAAYKAAGKPHHVHERRSKETCEKIEEVAEVAQAKRSPFAWECMTCPAGTKERINEGTACKYMILLQTARHTEALITTHAAIEDDSSLLKYASGAGGEHEREIIRAQIIDEEINRVAPIDVKPQDITSALLMVDLAITKLDNEIIAAQAALRGPIAMPHLTRNQRKMLELRNKTQDQKAREDKQKALKLLEESRDWLREITPEIQMLGAALGAADPAKWVSLSDEKFDKLRKLLGKKGKRSRIPEAAMVYDGTILEDVSVARANRFGIPASWLKALGQALSEGNAWFFKGAIVGGYTSKLLERFLKTGGINLDATPSIRAVQEIERAGGRVLNISVAAPMLSVVQWGPHLHGRQFDEKSLEKALGRILPKLEEPIGKVCVLTHKPIAEALIEKRPDLANFIGYWGNDERAHNRWEQCDKLVIFGLPLMSGDDAAGAYAIDCAAMKSHGIDWQPWTGEIVRRAWVEVAGGKEVQSAAPLPAVADARAWLLDKIAAQLAQGIGRLRAVRRTNPVQVDIFGAIPLVGHGIQIVGTHISPGRLADHGNRMGQVATAVIHQIDERAELPTRREVMAYLSLNGWGNPSATTIDKVMGAIRRAALLNKVTMFQMCNTIIDDLRQAESMELPEAGEYQADAGYYLRLAWASAGTARAKWLATARMRRAMQAVAKAAFGPIRRAGP